MKKIIKGKNVVNGLAKLMGCAAFAVPAVLIIGAAVLLAKEDEDKRQQEAEDEPEVEE